MTGLNFVFRFLIQSLTKNELTTWCGPYLGLRKDNSEHGISLRI